VDHFLFRKKNNQFGHQKVTQDHVVLIVTFIIKVPQWKDMMRGILVFQS